MGQLFVVNDCVSQEELLSHISHFLRSQKKGKKTFNRKRLCKKDKLGFALDQKKVKNINNSLDVCELPSLKDISSSATMADDFRHANGMLKKSQSCHINGASSSDSGAPNINGCAQINKPKRKRKRVTKDEDRIESHLTQKVEKSCDILKKKLKQDMSAEKKLKSELIIRRKVDYEENEISYSFDEKSLPSCDNIGVMSPDETFPVRENRDLNFQQGVGSRKHIDSNDKVSICNRGDGSLTKTSRQLKMRRKISKTEKVKQKAVKDTTILLEESDSKKIQEDYLPVSGSIDSKSQRISRSCEIGASESNDSDWTTSEKNGSFCLGRVFDSESSTLTDPADVIAPKFDESSQELCDDTSVQLSAIKNIPDQMYVAVDCEMVGIGPKGKVSVLARCSIVDYDGNVIYDRYVRPTETITDYRTRWSGIRPVHMKTAVPIHIALKEIKECLDHKVVIGHAVYHDFKVLGIVPDHLFVRDTAQCHQLVEMAELEGKGNGLKKLAVALLGRNIQDSMHGHCSVEDARATLDLFKLVRHSWEPALYLKWAKKDANICSKITTFIDSCSGPEDFLNDKFWPSHILD